MENCTNCNAIVKPSANFCSTCGTKVNNSNGSSKNTISDAPIKKGGTFPQYVRPTSPQLTQLTPTTSPPIQEDNEIKRVNSRTFISSSITPNSKVKAEQTTESQYPRTRGVTLLAKPKPEQEDELTQKFNALREKQIQKEQQIQKTGTILESSSKSLDNNTKPTVTTSQPQISVPTLAIPTNPVSLSAPNSPIISNSTKERPICPVCSSIVEKDKVVLNGQAWHRKCWVRQSIKIVGLPMNEEQEKTKPPTPQLIPVSNPTVSHHERPQSPKIASPPVSPRNRIQRLLSKSKEKKKKKEKKEKLKVFGTPLKKILEVENRQTFLPIIVERAVVFLDGEGLDVEGIFRISARLTELQNVCKMIDDGAEIDFYNFTKDPHLVAGVLKKWFRELPDALLTFELYDCFIAIRNIKDDNIRFEKLKAILRMLPDTNSTLVEYMLDFIARVSRHQKSNKMTVSNLATIFGPIFLRSSQLFDELISETSIVCGVLIELIEKRDVLFGDPK